MEKKSVKVMQKPSVRNQYLATFTGKWKFGESRTFVLTDN